MYTTAISIVKRLAGTRKFLLIMLLVSAISHPAWAQNEKSALRGRIVNSEGKPLAGAVVNVVESSSIARADENGFFDLKNVKATDEIFVSSAGYFSKTVPAEFGADFLIVLEADADEYAHTMPVPFLRKQKRLTTEATSVVTGEELQRHPITVLQNAFTSTVTGVETYEWASEPGWTESAIYIRGLRTMNSSARSPLIIVDNVERDLSFLDAYPIENITILKDAAACAIYGMRGANGVVMVTTRRGEAGRTKINFTQEVGYQLLSNKMETQNAYNMALTRNQVRYLDGMDPLYSDETIEKYRRVSAGETLEGMERYRYFNTSWYEELYREMAPMHKTNLSISGGNERTRYFISGSYLRQEGMWNSKWTEYNDGFSTQHVLDRFNLRSNIDIDVNSFLNVSLDLGGRIDDISQPYTGVFSIVTFGAVEANPMEPVYTPNGEIYATNSAQNAGRLLASSGLEKNRRRNLYSTVNLNGDLGSITPGLAAKTTVSFDSYETFESSQTNNVNSFNYDYTADVSSVAEYTLTRFSTYSALENPRTNPREYYFNVNFNAGLSYERAFGEHAVSAQAFIRTYKNVTQGSESSNRYLSYNAQASYVYANRYILSGSISRMASDNFAPEERWGVFPGVSAGWALSEESWLKSRSLTLLKLRASYGRAGQANTGAGRYPYQSTYGSGASYNFGTSQSEVSGIEESKVGNLNSKWEISDMLNAGADFDFWGRKLYGAVDAFKEWRSNILVTRTTVPIILGVSAPQDSYGKVESKGVEATLGHRNRLGKLSYYLEGMLTWNTNQITEMDELEPNVPWQAKTGKRIFDYTEVAAMYESSFNNGVGGWEQYRFVQWASDPDLIATSQQDAIDHPEKYPYNTSSSGAQKLGTAVFQDLNSDRQIDVNDKIPTGYTIIPELIPSVTLGIEWRGFDARAILTAYLHRSVFLSPAISFSGWSNMGTHEVTKAWGYFNDDPADPRNLNATYPRPTYGGFSAIDSDRGTGTYHNDIWIKDGSYLSFRNIEVGYSLPKALIAKVNMTSCRLYFSGYNLFTFSDLPDRVDPEKPMSYCWWYPKTRSFSFGINIGF